MLFFELTYIAFCIVFAAINAGLIKSGKRIYHGFNGSLHIAAALACGYFWWRGGFFIILLNSRVFFDYFLNIFRGMPLGYVPLEPKSLVDKVEKKLFGRDAYLPKIVWLCISLVLNAVYFIFLHK